MYNKQFHFDFDFSLSLSLSLSHEVGSYVSIVTKIYYKKFYGPGGIMPYIVESLTSIFNLCIEQNVFPTDLKKRRSKSYSSTTN